MVRVRFRYAVWDLAVKIFKDGGVFLVSHALFNEVLQSCFSCTIHDHRLLELGLEETEAGGDLIIIVGIVIKGGRFSREEADVAQFLLDAFIDLSVVKLWMRSFLSMLRSWNRSCM